MHLKRRQVVSRVTRKLPGNTYGMIYKPEITAFHELGYLEKEKPIYGYFSKSCSCCGENKIISDFYVKTEFKEIPTENLEAKHMRSICIECFDDCNKNNKRGIGWTTSRKRVQEIQKEDTKCEANNTIEAFFL